MGCLFHNKDPLAIVNSMDSYFKKVPPDCSIFSSDGFEILFHKELLYQTKFMRKMFKSAHYMDQWKIEILCPFVSKIELQIVIDFLYRGKVYCVNQTIATQVFDFLTDLFGFPPKNFDFNGTVLKDESQDFGDDKVSAYSTLFLFSILSVNPWAVQSFSYLYIQTSLNKE